MKKPEAPSKPGETKPARRQGGDEERIVVRTEAVSSRHCSRPPLELNRPSLNRGQKSHRPLRLASAAGPGCLKRKHGNSRRRACRVRLLVHRGRAGSSFAFQIGEELDQVAQLGP